MGGSIWGQGFRAFVMSVPDSVDLLKASNWTFSNRMGFNPAYLNGDFGGWLEGNAVVSPAGGIVNLLRTHYGVNGDELLSVMKLNAGGTTATFNPDSDFVSFPGGCKKFTVRRDLYDPSYRSLAHYLPDRFKGNNQNVRATPWHFSGRPTWLTGKYGQLYSIIPTSASTAFSTLICSLPVPISFAYHVQRTMTMPEVPTASTMPIS